MSYDDHSNAASHEDDESLSQSAMVHGARVRPGDAAWPSANCWAALREKVGRRLIEVRPLFDDVYRAEDGMDPYEGIRNPFWLSDQPGGSETSGWIDAWSPEPSAFAIKVQTVADVQAGVDFARERNLRLVIKGTGHSYFGASNAPDSLLIWTRAMRDVTLHEAFVPHGCAGYSDPAPAVSAGAGAMWVDLYHAVTTIGGRYVQGGGCMSVGVAGLVQGGGYGIFSKKFGIAASSLLEAEIVTADGQVRIANERCNPDLFWALKGGGAGTYGVVTRLTLRTHDLPLYFGSAEGAVEATSDPAFRRLIEHFIIFYRDSLLNPHWGDHVHFGHGNDFEFAMVCQGLTDAQTREVWQPFFDWIAAYPEDFVVRSPLVAKADDARHWWNVETSALTTRDLRAGAPAHHGWSKCDQDEAGVFLHGYDSLWLPASLLEPARQQELGDALFSASRHQMVRLQMATGLAGADEAARRSARNTSTHPDLLDAFTLAVIADGEAPAFPGMRHTPVELGVARDNAAALAAAITELRKIAPEAGSYVAESDYHNRRWQLDFWGSNYARLLKIKQRYDPANLFYVRHGVGSEGWSDDGFTPPALT